MKIVLDHIDFLESKGLKVDIIKSGTGSVNLITLPGVGMDENYFLRYFNYAKNDFTCYHFSIKADHSFRTEDLENLWRGGIEELVQKEGILEFNIVAYSIGARLVGCLDQVKELRKVVLICPDGVVDHPIFDFVTKSGLGKTCFYFLYPLIRRVHPRFKKYIKLNSNQLFGLWKRLSVFKFPADFGKKTIVFLANHDFLVSKSKVRKAFVNNELIKVSEIQASHFSILPIIKHKILKSLK